MNKYAQLVHDLRGQYPNTFPDKPNPGTTDVELDLLEIQLGHPLPPDYREFLRGFGGYLFAHGVSYPIQDSERWGDGHASLERIYGVFVGGDGLIDHFQNKNEDWGFNGELLPIAEDAGSNNICLAIAGEYSGAVFYWFRDGYGDPFSYDYFYRIADSFDEFMQSLFLRE